MEFLYEYGLFFAKTITLVIAILAVVLVILGTAVKQKSGKGELSLTNMSDELKKLKHYLNEDLMSKKQFKAYEKQLKDTQKEKEKAEKSEKEPAIEPKTFVINFKGSIDAHEVSALREEISAVLAVATDKDEVLVNVESGGGMVHGYGLAASQLDRIRQADIPLSICIDKVAASGGYMMACVANKVYAAPFAIVGSIGVIAQVPNFNRLLKKHKIDYEQHTAGDFKRTLTIFGENTDEAREKFKEELQETHVLFKTFIAKYRPDLDLEKVATGEHWYGQQAIELGLIDEIATSDDVIMKLANERSVFKVQYKLKKKLSDKIAHGAQLTVNAIINQFAAKDQPLK
ncbi:protease SohB [uncultured Shewanella sp.]|uniref:protease SohB n=1 Tax=uncultured Shewanella sp. TaxID=173975 RepID=UPI002606A6DF|nr:protease SohB [uncultured Shewanella sp.]